MIWTPPSQRSFNAHGVTASTASLSPGELDTPYMKTLRRTALATTILIAAFWAMSPQTQAAPPSTLLGAWELRSVGGKDPTTINIKSWQIEFREEGKWQYSGAMTGKYEGMKLSGSGTWLLQGSHLDYTAGANKRQTAAHFERSFLTLSPDPVIRLHGKEPVETQYVRAASR
jgi:hypothetical protein